MCVGGVCVCVCVCREHQINTASITSADVVCHDSCSLFREVFNPTTTKVNIQYQNLRGKLKIKAIKDTIKYSHSRNKNCLVTV